MKKKVVTNFPVLVQNETITSDIPSSQYDYEIFKKMYLDLNFGGSIFNQWVKKLESAKILNSSSLHLQLRNVELDSAVLNQIPDYLKKKIYLKLDLLKNWSTIFPVNKMFPSYLLQLVKLEILKKG